MTQNEKPASDTSLADSIAALEKHHEFPTAYMLKVIAFSTPDLVERVSQAACNVLELEHEALDLRVRDSKNSRYASVTLEPVVQDAAQVLALYQELKKLAGLISLI